MVKNYTKNLGISFIPTPWTCFVHLTTYAYLEAEVYANYTIVKTDDKKVAGYIYSQREGWRWKIPGIDLTLHGGNLGSDALSNIRDWKEFPVTTPDQVIKEQVLDHLANEAAHRLYECLDDEMIFADYKFSNKLPKDMPLEAIAGMRHLPENERKAFLDTADLQTLIEGIEKYRRTSPRLKICLVE